MQEDCKTCQHSENTLTYLPVSWSHHQDTTTTDIVTIRSQCVQIHGPQGTEDKHVEVVEDEWGPDEGGERLHKV